MADEPHSEQRRGRRTGHVEAGSGDFVSEEDVPELAEAEPATSSEDLLWQPLSATSPGQSTPRVAKNAAMDSELVWQPYPTSAAPDSAQPVRPTGNADPGWPPEKTKALVENVVRNLVADSVVCRREHEETTSSKKAPEVSRRPSSRARAGLLQLPRPMRSMSKPERLASRKRACAVSMS